MRGRLAAPLLILLAAAPVAAWGQTTDPADMAFWSAIMRSTNPAEYQAYLQAFPNGKFAPLARLRLGNAAAAAPAAAPVPQAPTPVATIRPVGPAPSTGTAAPPARSAPPAQPAALPAGRIDAMALSREAHATGRVGMFAKYRGKTLEIQGRFQRMVDLAVGENVSFDFVLPQGFDDPKGFVIRCHFPRRDTRAYDTMGAMKIGANVVIQGQIFDVGDHYQLVAIKPCAIIDPPLHPATDALASLDGPKRPPFGNYVCTTYSGVRLNPPIRIVGEDTFIDTDGNRRKYTYDPANGRLSFQGATYGSPFYGTYNFPGSPISGGSASHPGITLTPNTGGGGSIFCSLTR